MRIAFLTDIHGNLEALTAVLNALNDVGYDKLVVLGDLVGYGPDPVAVVEKVGDLIASGAVCIKGNHDEAACDLSTGMTDSAQTAIEWTRQQLHAPHIEFLKALPMQIADEDRLYVHASAHNPHKWHYIRSSDAADRCLDATSARLVFVGHTHIPAVFHGLPGRPTVTFVPATNVEMPISSIRRAVTVVGSVGQPRDGIPAACFGVLDLAQRTITMKRVPYDHSETAEKVRRAGLPFWLGDRLAIGK
jgi:diadenosine tetraphosphatase ApaH/serine/threonine PP2A family protein phosphatase